MKNLFIWRVDLCAVSLLCIVASVFLSACGGTTGKSPSATGSGEAKSSEELTDALKVLLEELRVSCEIEADEGSCYRLAQMFEKGEGTAADSLQAETYYRKACEEGSYVLACEKLSGSEDRGALEEACEKSDDASACFELGKKLGFGEGGTADYKGALKYYKKACDGGVEPACASLEKKQHQKSQAEAMAKAELAREEKNEIKSRARSACQADKFEAEVCTDSTISLMKLASTKEEEIMIQMYLQKACAAGFERGCAVLREPKAALEEPSPLTEEKVTATTGPVEGN